MNFNKVILGGHLTADPELKTTVNGNSVTSFTLAVNKKDKTNFLDVVAFKQTAEFITKFFHKGDPILLWGELSVNNYEKDGQKRKKVEVVVNEAYFAAKKDKEEASSSIDENDDLPF
jgi:single-strand DNA-binding protein